MTRREISARIGQEKMRENIRVLLSRNGLKHKDLANVLGLKQAAMSQRMTGQQWFSDSEIAATSLYFSTEIGELMGGSIYRSQSHQAWLEANKERDAERRRLETERKTAGRAICCDCGTVRVASYRWNGMVKDAVYDNDDRRGRMMSTYECLTCDRETRHAVLPQLVADRDLAAERQAQPDANEVARRERDAMVDRLRAFNIEVHFRVLGRPKYRRKHGTPVVAVRYDESKSQWRVELNQDVWPIVQLQVLKRAWEVISTDDQEWWEGLDGPTSGAWMFANSEAWETAVSGLIDEIHRAAPVVLRKTAMDIADSDSSRTLRSPHDLD